MNRNLIKQIATFSKESLNINTLMINIIVNLKTIVTIHLNTEVMYIVYVI